MKVDLNCCIRRRNGVQNPSKTWGEKNKHLIQPHHILQQPWDPRLIWKHVIDTLDLWSCSCPHLRPSVLFWSSRDILQFHLTFHRHVGVRIFPLEVFIVYNIVDRRKAVWSRAGLQMVIIWTVERTPGCFLPLNLCPFFVSCLIVNRVRQTL